ncbi:WD40-repeat-containing domain protein, partial [Dimargaris cristalligena]
PKTFDLTELQSLASQYPDRYWNELHGAKSEYIDTIDIHHPLSALNVDIRDQAAITGMTLSSDGTLLATCCNLGSVKIWDLDSFSLVQKLRDTCETHIDEFYVAKFTPDQRHLIVGGKLKDRLRWSEADEDNHILPCPLKVFDVLTGQVVARFEGHMEEILCIKLVQYKGENYALTTSQDGYIIKWHFDPTYTTLLDKFIIEDGITCMAFTVSFAPRTGNRYFLGACDDQLKLYDFEVGKLVRTFENIYSGYDDERPADLTPRAFAYFISRGVELLDAEDNTIASRPNTCTLHRLLYPDETHDCFDLEEVRRFHHDDYMSNSWLMKVAANGRYLCAPTLNGQIFVFHLASGKLTAILRGHEEIEVRDVMFHPTRNLLFTSGDDGCVKVFSQRPAEIEAQVRIYLEAVARGELDVVVTEENSPSASPALSAMTIDDGEANADKTSDEMEINIDS